ncbi:cupin domain-containing protein [Methylobacterium sp. M6A4_1b]
MMQGKYIRSLNSGPIEFESELGSIARLDADTMPILRRLSIKRLILAAGAVREPHWHANATELSYCVSGQTLMSVLDNRSVFSSFTVDLTGILERAD